MRKQLVVIALCFVCANVFSQTFHFIKGPLGNVLSIFSDNNGNIYLGTEFGVYRSTDAGNSWARYTGNNTYQGTTTYAFTTLANGNLVAAAGQNGVKIFTGSAWVNRNYGLPYSGGFYSSIRAIARDSSGNLFAGGYTDYPTPGGVFICQDTTWVSANTGLPTLSVNALAVSPSGVVYCGTDSSGVYKYNGSSWISVNNNLSSTRIFVLRFDALGNLFAGTSAGCSVLKPGNSVWTNYTSGLPSNYQMLSLSLDPTNSGRIIAGLGHARNVVGSLLGKIYVSNDTGKTWSDAFPAVQTLSAKASFILNDGTMFAGAQGVFRSSDHGSSWQTINNGFKDALPINNLVMNSKGYLFYGSVDGVFRSTNDGTTWEMINSGLQRPQVSMVFVDSHDNVYVGVYVGHIMSTLSARVFRSTNDGTSWDTTTISPDDQICKMDEGPAGTLYCSHGFGGKEGLSQYPGSSLSKSTDYGVTWNDLPVKAGMGYGLAVNKRGHIFHGGETPNPYRSTDGGVTWDTNFVIPNSGNVILYMSPHDEVFTTSYGLNEIWYSDSVSNGKPFTNMISPTWPSYHSPACMAWGKNNRMYVGTRAAGATSGLYYTDPPYSANSTFTAVPNIPVSPFTLFWDNNGYLWMQGPGFVAKSDSILGNPKTVTGAGNEMVTPKEFSLSQNYPNPFNPSTQISYQLPVNGRVSLKVYDVIGREAATLADDVKAAGYYSATFDASKLSSGIYFARLQSGDKVQLKKMILMK